MFLSRCQLIYLCIYRELIPVNTVRGCPWLQQCCPEFGITPSVLFQLWIKYWGNGLLWRMHVFLLFFSFPSCFFEPLRSNSVREAIWLPKQTGCIFSIRHLNILLRLTILQLYPLSSCWAGFTVMWSLWKQVRSCICVCRHPETCCLWQLAMGEACGFAFVLFGNPWNPGPNAWE